MYIKVHVGGLVIPKMYEYVSTEIISLLYFLFIQRTSFSNKIFLKKARAIVAVVSLDPSPCSFVGNLCYTYSVCIPAPQKGERRRETLYV
jgi:hypothetical protein